MIHTTKQPARTSTFPHAFAHPGEYYKSPLIPRVKSEADRKPRGWGIIREEQLGCEVATILLGAEIDHPAKRIIRNNVAKALYSTACFGFNGSQPILHVAGVIPSYRNVRLPRLDLNKDLSADNRQQDVIKKLNRQQDETYPTILKSIEVKGRFTTNRVETNARVLGECSLALASIPIVELGVPYNEFDAQDFAAMAANSLKADVARSIANDNVTPSIRQYIRRGSPAIHELIGHSNSEVSDLAWEVCRDL